VYAIGLTCSSKSWYWLLG